MIGLDTSILVRYLTQDDPIQSAKAAEIIEKQLSEEDPAYLSLVVITEIVWVLDRAYGFEATMIAEAIERMLQTDTFFVESKQEVFAALTALREGQGEFADALIAELGATAGCRYTLTFDRKAARLPGFSLA
jgi:predicted nucleic-acid-binding protein